MKTSVLVLDLFPGHCTINIYVAVKPQPSFAKEQIPEQLINEYPLLLGKLSLALPSAGFLASIKEWALLFIMGLLIFNSTSFFRIKKINYLEFIYSTNSVAAIFFLDLFESCVWLKNINKVIK